MSENEKDISKTNFKIYIIPVLIALGIVVGFNIYSIITYPVQRFSAIGVLDSSGGTSHYPKIITANDTVKFTVSVVNQEDMTYYYRVIVKYGHENTTNSLFHPSKNATELTHFDCILINELFIFHKMSFSIPEAINKTK
ncbi:MAG: hypothetical protein HWN67_15250, partial [Candidatus Helarchaeota archaeon]|nr:hypothetical protein [Candidatus Helarchaeota archaeon]